MAKNETEYINTAVAALAIAKNHKGATDGPVILSTGVRAILKPVPSATIEEAQSKIKNPPVPRFTTEDGVEMENPNDPDYLQAIHDANVLRGRAGFDVIAALCVELVDGLPPTDTWLKKLKRLDKLGHIDLSGFDLDDPDDLEFIYIRFVALASDDWALLSRISGVTGEAVARADSSFQS